MIRRFTVTALVGAAAVAGLVAGLPASTGAAVTPVAMVTSPRPADGPHGDWGHGPGWDGRHGDWDGRGGFGRGGGWDGNGGGWDGHRWWVSPDRCLRGHGHPDRDRFGWTCRGGLFNGAPIH